MLPSGAVLSDRVQEQRFFYQPKFHVQFHEVLWFCRTGKAINPDKFKIHWWGHQRGRHSMMGKLYLQLWLVRS